jgi:hypothetical protein
MRLEVEEDPVYGSTVTCIYSELKYMSASNFWIESKSNKITSVCSGIGTILKGIVMPKIKG